MVPSDVRVRADTARMHFDEVGGCAYCEMLEQERADGRRIVLESEHFVVFSPYAAFSPFHLWVVPKAHTATFLHITPAEVNDLGIVMHDSTQALRRSEQPRFQLRDSQAHIGRLIPRTAVRLNNPDFNYVIPSVCSWMRTIWRPSSLNNPDFNYVIRSASVRDLGAPYLHWYITIVPRISLAAGFELGSGIYINPSLPEDCAAFLRSVDDSVLSLGAKL